MNKQSEVSLPITTPSAREGELLAKRPGRRPPKASINPLMDAVRAAAAINLASEHLRNVIRGDNPAAAADELPDLKLALSRLQVLVREFEAAA